MKPRLLWFVALLVFGFVSPLAAQDTSEAMLARGVELRKHGKNGEALLEFQRAFQLSPTPRARAQVALAQQALGAWVEAEAGLRGALEARDDAWIQRNVAPLSAALETVGKHLGSLQIETAPAGASVFVNGQSVGASPLAAAVRAVAGTCAVEARLSGYAPASQTVTVPAGGELRVRLELSLQPPPAAAAPAPLAAPIAPAPTSANPTREDERKWAPAAVAPAASASGSGLRTGAIVSFVASGLFLAGGVTAHAIYEYRAAQYREECDNMTDCGDLRRVAVTARPLAYAGYIAAGATLITGIVLLIAAPSGDPAPREWQAELGPHSVSLGWRRAF